MTKKLLTILTFTAGMTVAAYAGAGCCSKGGEKTADKGAQKAVMTAKDSCDKEGCDKSAYGQKTMAKGDCSMGSCGAEKTMAKGESCTMKQQAKLVVVKMHHDACGTCKSIQPQLQAAKKSFDGKPVAFMTYDFTSDETKAASLKQAEQLGIADALKDQRGMGRVLIIDTESGEIVQTISGRQDTEKYVQAIQKDLGNA